MRCRPAGREGRERSARGGKKGPEEPGGRRRPRGEWGAPRCGLGGRTVPGRPEEGGGDGAAPFPPPPRCPLRAPRPVFPAGGLAPRPSPRRAPLARLPWSPLVSALPSPAFPADGGSRACGGARAPPPPPSSSAPVLPGRRARTVPSARLGTRGAAAGPRGAFRGVVRARPPTPGGPQSPRLTRDARRPPPPAARPGRFSPGSRRESALTLPFPAPCLSPPGPAPPAQASGPGSAPRLPRPCSRPPASRALPARAPLPAAAPSPSVARGGLGSRVRGGTRLWVNASSGGCLGRERGPARPRRLWRWGVGRDGERAVSGVGVRGRWRRPAGAWGASSVTGRQRRGFRAPRGWPRMGSASRRGGLWPRVPPPPASPVPPPPVQVPSASRRGGLKTLWGSPVRLGSGRSGPWGGGFPSPPDSAAHRTPGAGVAAPRHGLCAAVGRGLPGGPVGPCVCVCPACLGGCGGVGGNPLGACGVVRASPLAWGGAVAGCPVVQPFRPSRSLVSLVSDWPAGGTPLGECAVPGGGAPPGVGPLNDQNSYDS